MHKWLWRGSAALILVLTFAPTQQVHAEEGIAGFSMILDKADPDIIRQAIFNFSNNDISILQRIVEAEMTAEDIESKKNVASVVINRVFCRSFPDIIKDVVFQRNDSCYQFSPIQDKRYYSVEISKETIEAVNYVIEYGTTTQALYFRATKPSTNSWWNDLNFLMEDTSGTYYYN